MTPVPDSAEVVVFPSAVVSCTPLAASKSGSEHVGMNWCMTSNQSFSPDAATGNKLAADEITDKRGFAARWHFSVRHVDNLLAQGMPHLKCGQRRVRLVVAEADAWMKERFGTRRLGPANPKAEAL